MQAACGEPIIFHDDILERTTNSQGDVSLYTYDYLRSLDAGAWFNPTFSGERIPTLQQVIGFLKNMQMSANVEIKSLPGKEEPLVIRALSELENHFDLSSSRI